jgi:hypothetical protein
MVLAALGTAIMGHRQVLLGMGVNRPLFAGKGQPEEKKREQDYHRNQNKLGHENPFNG